MLMLDIPNPALKDVPPVVGNPQHQGVSGIGEGWVARNRRRLVSAGAFLALTAAAGGAAWSLFLRPISVQIAAAEADVPVQVFGLGTVEARVTSKIGFKVSGVVVDLRADVGDRVAKGAVLARLDDREQSAQLARAKATVEQTEANLQRATASVVDPVMDREFSRIRSVDVPAFTDAYNQYKNVAKQQLFDPRAQRDQQYYQQLNQQKNEALANVFGIADKSSQFNQMGKDLMIAKRSPHAADIFADNSGEMIQKMMNTPYDQLGNVQLSDGKTYDLTNPDSYRYQHTIDFNKLQKNAYGTEKEFSTPSEANPNDKLSTITKYYKYGNNRQQFHDNLVNQLAKLPTGEREAASAMQQYEVPLSDGRTMEDHINDMYYNADKNKWLTTTGQPNPIPVEAQNPNSYADRYSALMAKMDWLHRTSGVGQTPVRVQNNTNKEATRTEINTQQDKMQQARFQQEKIMERIKNNDITGRDDLRRLHVGHDAGTQDYLTNAYFEDEVKKGTPIEISTKIQMVPGDPLKGSK